MIRHMTLSDNLVLRRRYSQGVIIGLLVMSSDRDSTLLLDIDFMTSNIFLFWDFNQILSMQVYYIEADNLIVLVFDPAKVLWWRKKCRYDYFLECYNDIRHRIDIDKESFTSMELSILNSEKDLVGGSVCFAVPWIFFLYKTTTTTTTSATTRKSITASIKYIWEKDKRASSYYFIMCLFRWQRDNNQWQ